MTELARHAPGRLGAAFALPALLPGYIDRGNLTKTEAGWLIGVFFAAYVAAVPVLVALTDRVPARRVYMTGAALTALSHLGFAVAADGFWSGFLLRAIAGQVATVRGQPRRRGDGRRRATRQGKG